MFAIVVTVLSAAVDVYSDWIDACDEVAREAAEQDADDRKFSSYGARPEGGARAGAEADDEDGGYGDDD